MNCIAKELAGVETELVTSDLPHGIGVWIVSVRHNIVQFIYGGSTTFDLVGMRKVSTF